MSSEWRLIVEIRINLLAKPNSIKEKRSVYLIPVLGITAVMAAASFLTYSYVDTKDSVKVLSERLQHKQQPVISY